MSRLFSKSIDETLDKALAAITAPWVGDRLAIAREFFREIGPLERYAMSALRGIRTEEEFADTVIYLANKARQKTRTDALKIEGFHRFGA
jgi:hypothetical protein